MTDPGEEVHPSIREALAPGEVPLWTGQPTRWAYLLGGVIVTYPLGVIAVASAWTWTSGSSWDLIPPWAKGVLAVVLLFATHMLIIRPLLGLYLARHTHYAVTDRRALVICDALGGRIQELRHGEGDLIIQRTTRKAGKIQFGRAAGSSVDVLLFGRAAIPGFYGLRPVKAVETILTKCRDEHGDRSARSAPS